MRERPFLLAILVEVNSDSSLSHTLEENKSRVNSERGEKRKTAGLVDEEEERGRQRKAAKKAKKEKERLEVSTRMATSVNATNHFTARPRLLDIVARLVSRKEKTSESSSGKAEQEYPVVEDISYEQVQEEAGRCSHGPPTDYPCHICCYNKWTMTRRLEQPGVEKAEGNLGAASGDHDVTMIEATNEPLAGGNSAETRENVKSTKTKREHSEGGGRDHGADILFDGITVGPLGCKAKKINDEVKTGEKPNVIRGLATTVKAAKGSIAPQEEDQVKNIVKNTKWAEVFRSSGVTISKAP